MGVSQEGGRRMGLVGFGFPSAHRHDNGRIASPVAPRSEASRLSDAIGLMRARGLRASAARRLVLEALLVADGPMSAEQIAQGIGGRVPHRTSDPCTATSKRWRKSGSFATCTSGTDPDCTRWRSLASRST